MSENKLLIIDQNLVDLNKNDDFGLSEIIVDNKNQTLVLENHNSQNILPIQATTDEQIVNLWLYGKSTTTQSAYSHDIQEFLTLIGKPLNKVILSDLQQYGQSLVKKQLLERSQARKMACIKSLLSFATKLGYLYFDIGKAVKLPKYKDDLASRILDESTIIKIIYSETKLRNHLFLKTSYLLGTRVSEIINLTWSDFSPSGEHVGVTLFGKGGKTRTILITNKHFEDLRKLKTTYPTPFVFVSNKGKTKMTRIQAFRIVKKAILKCGVDQNVSPHWFRHAHASHALSKGAPMPLIQRDLGHSSLAITGRYLHVKPTDGSGLWLSV